MNWLSDEKRSKWGIQLFPISDKNLKQTKRLNPGTFDCVFNAFELIGFYDSEEAKRGRIKANNKGLYDEEIEDLLNKKWNSHDWRIKRVKRSEFIRITAEFSKASVAMFCFAKEPGFGHVFLTTLMKDENNNDTIVYIDPQQNPVIRNIDDAPGTIGKRDTYAFLESRERLYNF